MRLLLYSPRFFSFFLPVVFVLSVFISCVNSFLGSKVLAQACCANLQLAVGAEICPGDDFTLSVTQLPDCEPYEIDQTGAFSPIAGSGTVVLINDNDETFGPFPIGFTFTFYGLPYTEFYISTNGYISFEAPFLPDNGGCCAGQFLPNLLPPNNLIAFAWEDLDPCLSGVDPCNLPPIMGGGTVEYFVNGVAPNRQLVVNFTDVPHQVTVSQLVTAQIVMSEADGKIEIHTTRMDGDDGPHTMGIENHNGTKAMVVPGRNADPNWDAFNDYVSFTPTGGGPCGIVSWSDSSGPIATGTSHTVSPATTTTYTADVTCGTFSCTNTVTVVVDETPPEAFCRDLSVILDNNNPTANLNFGNVLGFDGADDYVMVPDAPSLQWAGELTIEMWVNPSGTTGSPFFNSLITKMNDNGSGFWLNLEADYRITLSIGAGLPIYEQLTSVTALPLDNWTHVAVTFDGTSINIYLNGSLDASIPFLGGMDTNQGVPLIIGSSSGYEAESPPFHHNYWGKLDDIRLWSVARTEAEIQSYMFQEFSGGTANIRGVWPCNDGTGSGVLTDVSQNANIGTLTNMDVNTAWSEADLEVLDGGSRDECGIVSGSSGISIVPDTFGCDEIGNTAVTLSVVDVGGNVSTCTSQVTVTDLVLPTALCKNISVYLDPGGNASIVSSATDNGSSDNCRITYDVQPYQFSCGDVGNKAAWLTVTDQSGNTDACSSTIVVFDKVPPTPKCRPNTVYLDNDGMGAILPSDVDDGSSDACGIKSMSVQPNQFDCDNLFIANPVTLRVTDVNNNTADCTANITVIDNIAPSVTCSDDVRECTLDNFVFYPDPVAEDNCEVVAVWNNPPSGSQFVVGETIVTGYAVDNSGNTGTCTFEVSYHPLFVTVNTSDYNGYGVSCANGADGVLTAIPDGGFPSYGYLWSDGQTNMAATGLVKGFYTVTVTDDNACIAVGSAVLTGTPPLTCEVNGTDISCNGANDGTVTALPSGGVGGYTMVWSGPAGFSSADATISPLEPGDYHLTVTDLNACECVNSYTVREPEPLVLDTTPADVENGMSGPTPFDFNTYFIDICGGVQPFNTEWETIGYVRYAIVEGEDPECMQIVVLFLDEAEWSVTVNDANGCQDQATVFADEDTGLPEIVSTDVTAAEADCFGGDGAIELTVEGGTPPYNYAWSGPPSWTSPAPGPGGSTITGLPSGWFSVTITDSANPANAAYGWSWVPCGSRGKTSMKEGDGLLLDAYPNPLNSKSVAVFSLDNSDVASLQIYDISGRQLMKLFDGKVQKGKLYQLQIPVSNLQKGIYLARLHTQSGQTSTRKLVILE